MREKIYAILNAIRPEVDFSVKEDFFDGGFRDSMDFVQFVTQLTEQFGIELDGLDIVPENFCNIEAVEALLQKYNVA